MLKFLKLVLLSQCLIFYQHNNTSKEREENKNELFFKNESFISTFTDQSYHFFLDF